MRLLRFPLLTLLLLFGTTPLYATALSPTTAHSVTAITAPALYDKAKDTLSVEANAIPLKDILGHIAMQSGIEVLFDGRADRPVTAKFKERPFEEALKNLLKESNYSLRYSEQKKGKKPMLIGVKVLPAGEQDGHATPLMLLQGEAFIQEKNHRTPLSAEEANRRNLSYERWKARLAELPPALREKVEKKAKDRIDKQEQKKREREKRHAAYRAKNESRRAEREARRQAMLASMSPEERALAEQRRENARKMAQQQHNNSDE